MVSVNSVCPDSQGTQISIFTNQQKDYGQVLFSMSVTNGHRFLISEFFFLTS